VVTRAAQKIREAKPGDQFTQFVFGWDRFLGIPYPRYFGRFTVELYTPVRGGRTPDVDAHEQRSIYPKYIGNPDSAPTVGFEARLKFWGRRSDEPLRYEYSRANLEKSDGDLEEQLRQVRASVIGGRTRGRIVRNLSEK
jgi:hypothetical protein